MTLPIFFTFNDKYVKPAAVAFFSLLHRASPGVRYEMHVLHHDISPEGRDLLNRIVEECGNAALTFVDTGDFLEEEWALGNWSGNQTAERFSSDAVVRCFAARFFPQYDKIIYSDVDVVFADDISDLWQVDLSGVYLAGVNSPMQQFYPEELSHLRPEHRKFLDGSYVSGGLWLMNLARIRADRLEDRMMEIVRDPTIVKRWNDQDVMNIACEGQVAFLPLNYIALPFLDEAMRRPGFTSPYSREELYDSLIRPKIIHFAGQKPWLERVNWDIDWWAIAEYIGLEVKSPQVCRPREVEEEFSRLRRMKRRWRSAFLFSATMAVLLAVLVGIMTVRTIL